jgi:hypothetical protein
MKRQMRATSQSPQDAAVLDVNPGDYSRIAEMLANRRNNPVYSVGQGVAQAGGDILAALLEKQAFDKQQAAETTKYGELVKALTTASQSGQTDQGPPMSPGMSRNFAVQQLAQVDPKFAVQNFDALGQVAREAAPEPVPPQLETIDGPRGSRIQRNPLTGEEKQIVGPDNGMTFEQQMQMIGARAQNQQPPSAMFTPLTITDPNTGQPTIVPFDNRTGMPGQPLGTAPTKTSERPLSATEQRELFEAEDVVNAGSAAMKSLNRALELNNVAASGKGAGIEQALNTVFNPEADAATAEFKASVLEQALQQLKTTFGGNPTEGERSILLDIQASPNMTRASREALLKRAIAAVNDRVGLMGNRMQGIKGGNYSQRGGAMPTAAPAQPNVIDFNDLPKAGPR